MMVEKLPRKGHQLTIGEAIGRMRAKSSRGLLAKDWEDTPELCQQVLIELENIKNGTPSYGWVNAMGKREKKNLDSFTRKGSRLISYYDIPVRIAEQMIFGDIMDQLCRRDILLTSVGHMNPLDYFELISQEECEAGRGVETGLSDFLADYVAGWDTTVRKFDLEEGELFLERLSEPSLRPYVKGFYRMYANQLTLIKRPRGSSVDLSIVLEKKGRPSGYVGTYTMNTVTNTVKSLAHICVALGIKPLAAYELLVTRHLNLYISGDDKVIAGDPLTIRALSVSVDYWKKSGYLRKNLSLEEPSVVYQDFSLLPFCSHVPQRAFLRLLRVSFLSMYPQDLRMKYWQSWFTQWEVLWT